MVQTKCDFRHKRCFCCGSFYTEQSELYPCLNSRSPRKLTNCHLVTWQ